MLEVLTSVGGIDLYPLAMELKPLLYLFFTFVWANRFGVPSAHDFIRAGTFLAAIVTGECLVKSLLAHSVARPLGSGEINYDACLLLLSFALALNGGKQWRKQLLILGVGLFCSFSRTAQAAAVILALASSGLSLAGKFSVATGGLLGFAASFPVRSITAADISAGDRFYMWSAAAHLFAHDPLGFLFGYRLGVPLEVAVPSQLQTLWGGQAHSIHEHGVFAYNFHSMWIRLIVSWGAVTVLALIAMLLLWMINKHSRLVRSVVIVILIEGLTMGVFYLSNVAIPVLLFMLLAARLAKTKPVPRVICP